MAWFNFLTVGISTIFSWCLLWVLLPILSNFFLDQPNSRSSHCNPTPRGGGVVFVAVAGVVGVVSFLLRSSSATTPLGLLAAPLLALPLALVGFLDDRQNLPATWRYGVQLATALIVILLSPLTASSLDFLPLIALLLIAVTAVINFTNFMDGLDGLVAGCMAVTITSAAIQLAAPLPIWSLVGALLGFLFWNWSPAKVFMGDVGSTFLGAVFSTIVLQASSWPEALALLLVATPLLGDACLCVPRRLMAGHSVFQAHRLHLFQRLHQAGWSHARVSSLYIAATAVLAIALLWGGLQWVITLSAIELLFGFWLDQLVAVPFSLATRN
ncbi:glycosyl transferase 4 family protein [Synechococcus sp. RS9915]|nr:glycosyl transferase 4 family protein [Synechococcus sp. RS9915]